MLNRQCMHGTPKIFFLIKGFPAQELARGADCSLPMVIIYDYATPAHPLGREEAPDGVLTVLRALRWAEGKF